MTSTRTPAPDSGEPEDEGRSRANIVAVVFIAVLLAGALLLFKSIQDHRQIENCVASGRRDCIPLVPTDSR